MKEKMNINNLVNIYRDTDANYSNTADRLGINRRTLYNHIHTDPELKAELDKVKKELRSAKGKRVYSGRDKSFGIMIPESKDGKLITDKMRKTLEETRGKNTTIFDLAIDQLSLRDLMDTVKAAYNKNKIDNKDTNRDMNVKEYAFILSHLHKTYASVTRAAEEIALKKMEGKTPAEFYDEAYNFIRTIFETLKELIGDPKIRKEDIIGELCERIGWQIDEE